MAIRSVGVVGCGLMGGGIAQVSIQAGFPTIAVEANQQLLDRGLAGVKKNLDTQIGRASCRERV